jgi:hypothetical protein
MQTDITFRSPPRQVPSGPSTLHKRRLEAVPEATASEMASDFVAYQRASDDGARSALYRYQSDGEDVLAP